MKRCQIQYNQKISPWQKRSINGMEIEVFLIIQELCVT